MIFYLNCRNYEIPYLYRTALIITVWFVWKLVDVLISYVIWHILMKIEQFRSNCSCDIDEKVIFPRKMLQLWKNKNFKKWPLGLFYDPPCPLTSCKKSEKSKERILRKMQKTDFWSFWARFRHIWAQMGRTGIFFKNLASSLSFPY